MGYVNPNIPPDCPATYTFFLDGRYEKTQTARAMDKITFHCRLRAEHKLHLADHDFPKLGKRITINWGDEFGKPRIIETQSSSVG